MFGDDSFMGIEDLFNQFARGTRSPKSGHYDHNTNLLNTITKRKKTYFIFDFSGKKIESVTIQDNLETNEYGEQVHDGNKVLKIKYNNSEILKYILPKNLRRRKIEYTFSNGILEVSLKK